MKLLSIQLMKAFQVTPEEKKLVVSCLLSKETSEPALPVLVTVCEARMQAEILHGLEAVTQFMKS